MFYATFRCTMRACERVWKSSYFRTREEAQLYVSSAPKRGRRARCTEHRRSS